MMNTKNKTNSILIKNADYLVTMDKESKIFRKASIYIEGPEIKEVNSERKIADKAIDASGMIVLPGFINCHHHVFQSLFKNVPAQHSADIQMNTWLKNTMNMAREIDPEDLYYAALTAFSEAILSGCTTLVDFHYIHPKGRERNIEQIFRAAKDIGIRFHQFRGSMSLGDSDLIQDRDTILIQSERLIRDYHDSRKFSMIQVGVGPCTPFTNTKEDYIETAKLARKYKVLMQTHIAESPYEVKYFQEKAYKSPINYLSESGWQGKDVSLVHAITIDKEGIEAINKEGTNIVHCPIVNIRKGVERVGVCPILRMLEKGINICIGVDGSASNDSSNMLEEMRWARNLHGVKNIQPLEVLRMGIVNGAKMLNREDIGSIEEGKAADLVVFDVRSEITHAGATADPIGSLVVSQAILTDTVIINGEIVVEKKSFKNLCLSEVIYRQNCSSERVIRKAELNTGCKLTAKYLKLK